MPELLRKQKDSPPRSTGSTLDEGDREREVSDSDGFPIRNLLWREAETEMRIKDRMSYSAPSDSGAVRWHHWHVAAGSLSLSHSYLSAFPPALASHISQTPIMCPWRETVRDTHTLTPFSSLISGFGRSVLLPGCQLNRNESSPKLRNPDQHVWSCDCDVPLPSPAYMRQVRYVMCQYSSCMSCSASFIYQCFQKQLLESIGTGRNTNIEMITKRTAT